MHIGDMLPLGGEICSCGRVHPVPDCRVEIGKGAIGTLGDILGGFGAKRVFLLADQNTYAVAGEKTEDACRRAGVSVKAYVFPAGKVEPDEHFVGKAMLHFDAACDAIVGVGSGVINDIGKVLASVAKVPYVIVGTAPSMDGYASSSSSMERDGLKVSLPTKTPDAIIGDTEILATAPLKMAVSGLGDMLAKYVSICEWRIAHLLIGEDYCEEIASAVRGALAVCVQGAEGLLRKDESVLAAVFEGLVLSGAAMTYAGLSRPASGVEHYISHVWDMRAAAKLGSADMHGLQCAVGTVTAVSLYEKLMQTQPDRARALAFADAFDFAAWSEELRRLVGAGAEAMLAAEEKDGKYDKAKHAVRLEKILAHWEEILRIAKEELPSLSSLRELCEKIGAPIKPQDVGQSADILPDTIRASKDIRDKYVLSRLLWDLGLLDEFAEAAKEELR